MAGTVDIISAVVVGIIVLLVSFYLFTMYCHPEERGFGNSLFPKILVIVSQAFAWGQLLLLPLDLSITTSDPSSNFLLVYEIIYSLIFALVVFLNPLAMHFYESDESDSFASRLCWSFLYAFIIAAVWCAVIFISYVWLGVYTFQGSEYRLNAALYIFIGMSIAGWVLLAFNGGIGLVYLPYDLIRYFVFKPKHLTPEEAFAKKQALQLKSSELITVGEKLKDRQGEFLSAGGNWFIRKRNQGKFNDLIESYRKQINELEMEHEIFDTELKSKGTHPIVYVVSLIGGIFAVIGSIVWLVQLFGTMILMNGKPAFLFIDGWLSDLSSGSVSFIATIIYAVMVLYQQICLIKGNTVFGIRVPFVLKVHPLIVNKTYMNSLLFNANLMLLASLSTSLLALWAFPTYLASSSLGILNSTVINNLPLFSSVYSKRIPMIVMVTVLLLTLVVTVAQLLWRRYKAKEGKEVTA